MNRLIPRSVDDVFIIAALNVCGSSIFIFSVRSFLLRCFILSSHPTIPIKITDSIGSFSFLIPDSPIPLQCAILIPVSLHILP
jgi:hypothetical protein